MENRSFLPKKMKVCVVTHFYILHGIPIELERFFRNNFSTTILIAHPFSYSPFRYSICRISDIVNGYKEYRVPRVKLNSVLDFALDVLITCYFILKSRQRVHVYLGLNWLNTLVGLMLRMFGFCRNVIFYSIDFVERRFNSYLLNSLYHLFDIVVASKSDLVWNLGANIAKIRSQRWRFKGRLNQLVVPYGTFRIEMKQPLNEYAFVDRWKEKRVCFLGHLRSGQGLELLPGAIRLLLPYFPDLKLIIIGDGELKDSLERGFEKLGIKNNVVFLGIVNEDRLYHELSRVAVGLAPYSSRSLASYSDPAKVKAYLSFGIPVVITPHTSISEEVKNASAGIVCTYEEEAIAAAIRDMLSNYEFYMKLAHGALRLAGSYFWDVLYEDAMVRTLQVIERNVKNESDSKKQLPVSI